jgi:hypothetical protein
MGSIELFDSDEQPFWQDIKVKDVKLEQQFQKSDDLSKNVLESSITTGTIRMAERQLSLEEGQFLKIQSPGIESLRRLRIAHSKPNEAPELQIAGQTLKVSEPVTGLKVDISGRTPLIMAGLNPDLPIARIQGSFFARFLPNDAIVALVSFCSALILSLLAWLVDNFSKSKS